MSTRIDPEKIKEEFRQLISRRLLPALYHVVDLVHEYYETYRRVTEVEVRYGTLEGWIEYKWVKPKKESFTKYWYFYLRYYDVVHGKRVKRSKYLGKTIPPEIYRQLQANREVRQLLRRLRRLYREIRREAEQVTREVIREIVTEIVTKVESLATVPPPLTEEEEEEEDEEEEINEREGS